MLNKNWFQVNTYVRDISLIKQFFLAKKFIHIHKNTGEELSNLQCPSQVYKVAKFIKYRYWSLFVLVYMKLVKIFALCSPTIQHTIQDYT